MRCSKNILKFAGLGAVVVMLFSAGVAQADELTQCVQKKYQQIRSMRASFSQTLTHKESGSSEDRSGVISFKQPDLVRWETELPSPELLLVGKNVVWNYFPEEDVAYKYPKSLVHEAKTALQFVTGKANLDEEFYIEKGEFSDGIAHLMLFPKEPTQQMTEAAIWVEQSTCSVKRMKVIDFFGNENEVAFSDLAFNVSLEDSDFSFTPPEGVDVEDRSRPEGGAGKNGAIEPATPLAE